MLSNQQSFLFLPNVEKIAKKSKSLKSKGKQSVKMTGWLAKKVQNTTRKSSPEQRADTVS